MPEREDHSEFREGWPVVVAAMLGTGLGLSPLPIYTAGIFAPVLAHQFGWSFAQILAGFPILTVSVLFMGPVVGWLSDRWGVRRVALVSCVLFSLSYMSQSLLRGNLYTFYAIWMAMAVFGSGTLPITWTRAVNNRFHLRKGLALGLTLLGTGVFGIVCKPLAAWLMAHFGWRGAYVGIGALPLVVALPVAVWAFHDAGGRQSASNRRSMDAARAANSPGLTFGESLHDWRFWVMGIAFVPISFSVGGPIPNIENILKTSGFQAADIVSLAEFIGLSVIVGRVIAGWLIDRVWAPAVAAVLLATSALACLELAHGTRSYAVAALSISAIGASAGIEADLMAFFVARYLGMKAYGSIYGTLYACFSLGAGFGPAIYGMAFDRTHSYGGILTISGALFALGGLMLLTLGRYRNFSAEGSAGGALAPQPSASQAP